jgi:NitT/TauT family transport system permease protein
MSPLDDRSTRTLTAVASHLALLLVWYLFVKFGNVPKFVMPSPVDTVKALGAGNYSWWTNTLVTAAEIYGGYLGALVVGVLLALAVVYVAALKSIVMPFLAAFNSIPKIAIAPLFVIWFGLGAQSKILLAFLLALFPIFVNSLTGLGEIEPDILDLSRLAGGSPYRVFRLVRLMHATPYITDALKVAFPLALVGSIVGEFIGGNRGIGQLVLAAQFNLDTPLEFAALLSITVFTTAGTGLITLFERRFLKWRPSQRTR